VQAFYSEIDRPELPGGAPGSSPPTRADRYAARREPVSRLSASDTGLEPAA
jgi:hypothetical protein